MCVCACVCVCARVCPRVYVCVFAYAKGKHCASAIVSKKPSVFLWGWYEVAECEASAPACLLICACVNASVRGWVGGGWMGGLVLFEP